MEKADARFETLQVHGGYTPDTAAHARAVPIYQTSAYTFGDSAEAAELFALQRSGNIYTRIGNPTVAVLEERLALLEGGVGAVALASGMAAVTYSIMNIAGSGDHVVASSSLYGGTHQLFSHTLPSFGIEVSLVDGENPTAFADAITARTKAVYIETIGNPRLNVADIEAIASIAHAVGVPLIVDNTFATPYLCRPIEHGADIVVHSTTKYIDGHGTSIGGAVVDGGRFDWGSGRFSRLIEPDASYHNLSYGEAFGAAAYIARLRVVLLRDTGAALSPFNAFLQLLGVETLSLRMERHIQNTHALTSYLTSHPEVAWVSHPDLTEAPRDALTKRYLPRGGGAIFTFGVRGGYEASCRVIDRVRLFSHLANVGDAKSLIIHPASTTHQQLSEGDQRLAGITPDMIRVSVGLEHIDDLIEDLDQALRA